MTSSLAFSLSSALDVRDQKKIKGTTKPLIIIYYYLWECIATAMIKIVQHNLTQPAAGWSTADARIIDL